MAKDRDIDPNMTTGAPRSTLGIPPANDGPLQVLQQAPIGMAGLGDSFDAALELTRDQKPTGEQARRHNNLSESLARFLLDIVNYTRPGPERSTAISRAREAKWWAAAAIAMEKPGIGSAEAYRAAVLAPPPRPWSEIFDAEKGDGRPRRDLEAPGSFTRLSAADKIKMVRGHLNDLEKLIG
jgi:hypothetical protein